MLTPWHTWPLHAIQALKNQTLHTREKQLWLQFSLVPVFPPECSLQPLLPESSGTGSPNRPAAGSAGQGAHSSLSSHAAAVRELFFWGRGDDRISCTWSLDLVDRTRHLTRSGSRVQGRSPSWAQHRRYVLPWACCGCCGWGFTPRHSSSAQL